MATPKQSPQQEFGGGIVMIVAGTFFLVLVGVLAGREAWHAVWLRLGYRPAEAVVVERQLVEHGNRRGHPFYRLEVSLTYQADGREYQSWVPWQKDAETTAQTGAEAEAMLNRVQPGDRVTCYYARTDPAEVVLDRGDLSALWGALGGMAIPAIVVIVGMTVVATRWRVVWPRGVRTEVRDARRRLPRRFYLLAGAVLVCVVTVVLAFLSRGGEGILVLIPAAVVAIVCFRAAANLLRRTVLPSPEKRAAAAAAATETPAGETTSAAAVNEFFASLESPAGGQVADLPGGGRSATCPTARAAWNLAEPTAVSRGEYLPVRLKTNPFDTNKGKMGISLYLLSFPVIIVVGLAIHALRRLAASPAPPAPGAIVALLAAAGVGVVAGILLWIGWRQFRQVSGVTVEVSAHPFPACQSQEVAVVHANPAVAERVRVELLCEEDAYTGTGRHGPMTETKVVLRQPVPLDPPDGPGEARYGQVDVPLAPGSFSLRLHRVRWCLQARLGFWVLRYPVEVRDRPLEALAPLAGERPSNRVDPGVVSLWIDGDSNAFPPGATLTGGFHIRTHPEAVPLQKIELSVVWSAAKLRAPVLAGLIFNQARRAQDSPDMGVCHFEEHEATEDDAADLGARRQFRVVLPDGPPSFHGKQFDIRWTVRLRVSYADGDQSVCDLPFVLGGIVGAETPASPKGFTEE
jgi:hypothetical protein